MLRYCSCHPKKGQRFLYLSYCLDARPVIQKTWIQFKIDFRQAVKELRRTGGLKIQQLHANLVSKIISRIQEVIQPTLTPPIPTISSYLSPNISMVSEDPSFDSTVNLNAVVDPTVARLQAQVTKMKTMMASM